MKVLCLHGYNSTMAILGLNMKESEHRYKDVIKFYYAESPHDCPEPAEKYYVNKGFQAPFKSWL